MVRGPDETMYLDALCDLLELQLLDLLGLKA